MTRHITTLALLLIMSATASAQSLKDLFNKDNIKNTIEKVVDKATGNDLQVVGTWTYSQCKIVFESDNFLQKAGGAVAAAKLEDELGGVLKKIGIEQGSVTYTFNDDSTFTSTTRKLKSKGDYTIDATTHEMTLKMLRGAIKSSCTVQTAGNSMTMLYDADKLLSIISAISGAVDIKLLDTVSNLLSKYDGCKIGMEMTKTN